MINTGIMNHDFADVKAVMSETGKVHLGTGIAEGENRVTEATEAAISNPLLENNSMKGAKGVLINLTCGNDTSLHDIDLAINRVREEADENANIIWGVQKDENLNGKFKISVVSTGIDNENYYRNFSQNENITNIQHVEVESNLSEKGENQFNMLNSDELEQNRQTSFFVDLQETSNENQKEEKLVYMKPELKIKKKRSLFSKIFGLKEKGESENDLIKEIKNENESETEFKNEMKEVIEENLNKNNNEVNPDFSMEQKEHNDVTISELNKIDNNISEFETKKNQNELDDDLLQIPAF